MRQRLAAALLLLLAGCAGKERADLIVRHARVYTVDSAFSVAQAFAVRDGKILAVGSDSAIAARYEGTELDAGGKPVYPGFIDAHAHFVEYARSLFEVNLFDCRSSEEMVERVKTFAAAHPGEPWIVGRGWDQNKFPGARFPDNAPLNALFPDRPVLLHRVDGHAALANAKALSLAGVQAGRTLEGGLVMVKDGAPTGLLVDNAVGLLDPVLPKAGPGQYRKWLSAAQERCFARGLTTVTDCGLPYRDAVIIDSLHRQQALQMRVCLLLSEGKENFDRYVKAGPYKTDRLYINGFKVYADGALGSRGACLLQDYSDQPGWRGFLLHSRAHMDSIAAMLAPTDFQMCTHAIGDSANRVVLDIYGKYLKKGNTRAWRIEHAQVIDPADLPRFGAYSIVPSVQPTHGTSDQYWAGQRLGARLRNAYCYRQLLEQNGWLPLGTDFPVEDISPFRTFLAAVFRKDIHGYPMEGFQPENALSPEQALRGMTIWAARANRLDRELGSIEPGKKADFLILDRDILKETWDRLDATKVDACYLGGARVYPKAGALTGRR